MKSFADSRLMKKGENVDDGPKFGVIRERGRYERSRQRNEKKNGGV